MNMRQNSKKLFSEKLTSNFAAILILAVTIIVAIANFIAATKLPEQKFIGGNFPTILIIIDAALFTIISIYIFLISKKFIQAKRKDNFTFKFQTRIVAVLSALCIAPLVLTLIFSLLFFSLSSKSWFSNIISTSLDESLEISNIYIAEHRENISDDIINLKKYTEQNTKNIILSPAIFESSFAGRAAFLSLTEAVIFVYNPESENIKILAKTSFSFFPEDFEFKRDFKPNEMGYNLLMNQDDSFLRAIVAIETMPNTYLLVGKLLNDKVIRHIKNAESANFDYKNLKSNIKKLQKQYFFIFIFIILLIIFAVTLLAFNYSSRILLPIIDIVTAIRRVSKGHYDSFVNNETTNEEINILTKSFNHMVKQLGQKNSDLSHSKQILNSKKEFLETILGNQPAAVILLNEKKQIKLFNRAAKTLLKKDELNDADLTILLPELTQAFLDALMQPEEYFYKKIKISNQNLNDNFHIFISIEKSAGEVSGYIVNIFPSK